MNFNLNKHREKVFFVRRKYFGNDWRRIFIVISVLNNRENTVGKYWRLNGVHHEVFEIVVSVEFDVLHDYVHVDVEDELQPEKIRRGKQTRQFSTDFFGNSIECWIFGQWRIEFFGDFHWRCHCRRLSISTHSFLSSKKIKPLRKKISLLLLVCLKRWNVNLICSMLF